MISHLFPHLHGEDVPRRRDLATATDEQLLAAVADMFDALDPPPTARLVAAFTPPDAEALETGRRFPPGTPIYQRWRGMLCRCGLVGKQGQPRYVERGITVCDRWLSFENFYADMASDFEPRLSLERIDNDAGYSPDNCRWATRAEQDRNKGTNHVVEWRGHRMVVTDWAEFLGIKPNTLIYRLRRGWTVERALTTGASPNALAALVERLCAPAGTARSGVRP